jgi:chorismate mutase / prephenate dehydratase
MAMLGSSLKGETETSTDVQLAKCRAQIDEADEQIVQWLNRRAAVVLEVGKIKKRAKLPVTAPARERQVLARIAEKGKAGPLSPEALKRIYTTIIQEMKGLEKNLPG